MRSHVFLFALPAVWSSMRMEADDDRLRELSKTGGASSFTWDRFLWTVQLRSPGCRLTTAVHSPKFKLSDYSKNLITTYFDAGFSQCDDLGSLFFAHPSVASGYAVRVLPSGKSTAVRCNEVYIDGRSVVVQYDILDKALPGHNAYHKILSAIKAFKRKASMISKIAGFFTSEQSQVQAVADRLCHSIVTKRVTYILSTINGIEKKTKAQLEDKRAALLMEAERLKALEAERLAALSAAVRQSEDALSSSIVRSSEVDGFRVTVSPNQIIIHTNECGISFKGFDIPSESTRIVTERIEALLAGACLNPISPPIGTEWEGDLPKLGDWWTIDSLGPIPHDKMGLPDDTSTDLLLICTRTVRTPATFANKEVVSTYRFVKGSDYDPFKEVCSRYSHMSVYGVCLTRSSWLDVAKSVCAQVTKVEKHVSTLVASWVPASPK